MEEITSTDFQKRIGKYMSLAQREPITITSRGRPEWVMVQVDEYHRTRQIDNRRAYAANELPDDWLAELDKGYQGKPTPELDHLLDDGEE